jgi:hypothetical protein
LRRKLHALKKYGAQGEWDKLSAQSRIGKALKS